MHNVAMAQRALDLAAKQVTTRETFGELLEKRQGVQWMLADCASELYHGPPDAAAHRLQAEKGMDLRQENSSPRCSAHMVHKVVDKPSAAWGPGYSLDPRWPAWYTQILPSAWSMAPTKSTAGRSGECHRAYKEHDTTASAAGGDLL